MSTRTNYFVERRRSNTSNYANVTSPLSAVPLTPSSSFRVKTPSRFYDGDASASTATSSTSSDHALAAPRQRTRPAHRRELSITVPPPSKTLQSLMVPVQPQSQSSCLRSPFVLRGTTQTPTPNSVITATSTCRPEKCPYSVYADLEDLPTSASRGFARARWPPAIVFAVIASLLFILVTFLVLAPNAIKEALTDHIVAAWKHLCFDKPRGVVSKAVQGSSWGPPTPEEVQQLLQW